MKKLPQYHSANLIMKKGECGKGCLVLGDSQAPLNIQYIKEYEIGAIISIGFETVPKRKFENINYHYIKLSDKKTEPILDHLNNICSVI